jgi:hypothetical protein
MATPETSRLVANVAFYVLLAVALVNVIMLAYSWVNGTGGQERIRQTAWAVGACIVAASGSALVGALA